MCYNVNGFPQSGSTVLGRFLRNSSTIVSEISLRRGTQIRASGFYCPNRTVQARLDISHSNFLSQSNVSQRRSRQSYGSNPIQLVHNRPRIRTSVLSSYNDIGLDCICIWSGQIRSSLPSNSVSPGFSGRSSSLCPDVFPVRSVVVVVPGTSTPFRLYTA